MSLMTMSAPLPVEVGRYVPSLSEAAARVPSTRSVSSPSLSQNTPVTPPRRAQTTEEVSNSVLMYIGSLLRSLQVTESRTKTSPPSPTPPPSAPTSPTAADIHWQAKYQTPGEVKSKRYSRSSEGRDIEQQVKSRFRSALPYYRVWEIAMEEADSGTRTMGRGTPPHPHRCIFKREMSATQLFLKDYNKRRGLRHTGAAPRVNEVEVDIGTLKRRVHIDPDQADAEARARASLLKTQGRMPTSPAEKRRQMASRQHSPLTSY